MIILYIFSDPQYAPSTGLAFATALAGFGSEEAGIEGADTPGALGAADDEGADSTGGAGNAGTKDSVGFEITLEVLAPEPFEISTL